MSILLPAISTPVSRTSQVVGTPLLNSWHQRRLSVVVNQIGRRSAGESLAWEVVVMGKFILHHPGGCVRRWICSCIVRLQLSSMDCRIIASWRLWARVVLLYLILIDRVLPVIWASTRNPCWRMVCIGSVWARCEVLASMWQDVVVAWRDYS